jgi:beta-glucosidase
MPVQRSAPSVSPGSGPHPRRRSAAWVLIAGLLTAVGGTSGCGPSELPIAAPGSLSAPAGRGSFRLGAASAATQIEDQNPNTDWALFTRPVAEGGLGKGAAFVGEASFGYTRAIDDIRLLEELHLDTYRFSMEWARIEPRRGQYDEVALQHYSDLLDALRAAGIRPLVTVHHFSFPVWVDDPRDPTCAQGPSDTNLCGLGHPQGGPLVVAAMESFARLLATRFGDRVDAWGTLNEPVNYLLAAYGIGAFPPGKQLLFSLLDKFVPVVRDYLSAHAAIYRAIRAADTIDANGDGQAAEVGLSLSVAAWVPAKDGRLSSDPIDVAARDRLVYVYHHLVGDSLRNGTFDANLDGTPDEMHPEWAGTLDWLGVQYYFRAGVTGSTPAVPVLELTPCFDAFDFGACIAPLDATHCVPQMHYEYWPSGILGILQDLGGRYPGLPLLVSEAGIATDVGARRAENVVRTLEQIELARGQGIDVRGYLHWSLFDNFEWVLGFKPRFGLYRVDYSDGTRTPTEGARVMTRIGETRRIATSDRARFGGVGPLTPEPGVPSRVDGCTAASLGQ